MAYPSKRALNYSYTGFATGQGDNSFPGTSVDTDLANIKASVDEVIDFIELFARSDGIVRASALIGADDISTVISDAITAKQAAETARDEAEDTATALESVALLKASNLSDLANAGTARTNLGLGALAVLSSVSAAQIAANAVETAKLNDNAVTTAKIADSNVTTAKIADSNVTTAKIADSNVTAAKAANGFIVDRVYAEYTTYGSLSGTTPFDDTIPQVGEGNEIVTASLTPKSATNRLRVRFVGCLTRASGAGANGVVAFFVNGGADAVHSQPVYLPDNTGTQPVVAEFEYVPGATSAQAIAVRVGLGSGSIVTNGISANRIGGGTARCTLVIEEIKAS